MKTYTYQNNLIGKKQLRQLLAWSFTNYDSMQACLLADELKYLGFKYASQAGISISIEDLKVPFVKNSILEKANQEIHNSEKIFLKGKITDVERFQKIIDTWSLTSESLKNQIIYYFKNYDPLNSVYIMAFSGARGNLSQVRQLVGMRGLMSDPSGQIMNLPIKKNFREGLTITDYLMSGYGARKGIVDTALKTANSGYLTRRLIDVSQDILIREKDCLTNQSFLFTSKNFSNSNPIYNKILGRVVQKSILDPKTSILLVQRNSQITPELIQKLKEKNITDFSIRSPLTCQLYRAICQKCYGWDLANENLVDIGEAIGILAGQSIGEPGTQLTMRTFHTGGIFTSEARQQIISPINGIMQFHKQLKTVILRTNRGEDVLVTKNSGSLVLIPDTIHQNLIKINILRNTILFPKNNQYVCKDSVIGEVINTKKQIKTEIKAILSDTCGEIFIPKLKYNVNSLNTNRLIWILDGQLYNSPLNSFLNFYPDYKLNPFSYVSRTKLINHSTGFVTFLNNKKSLYQGFVKVNTIKDSLVNSKLEQLSSPIKSKNYLLTFDKRKYCVSIRTKSLKNYLQLNRNRRFGQLLTNSFRTLTGGIVYYKNRFQTSKKNKLISISKVYVEFDEFIRNRQRFFFDADIQKTKQTIKKAQKSMERAKTPESYWRADERCELAKKKLQRIKYLRVKFSIFNKQKLKTVPNYKSQYHRTMIWLGEETYKAKCEEQALLVENGDFISKGVELIPDHFSKTSGLVEINSKNNTIQMISVKSGLVYTGKKLKKLKKKVEKKLFFPGEALFSNLIAENLSLCEYIDGTNNDQLLIRILQVYELPYFIECPINSIEEGNSNFYLNLEPTISYSYKSNQRITASKSLNLVTNFLGFQTNKGLQKNITIELSNNKRKKSVEFHITEKFQLTNYITPNLRDKNIQPCFLIQPNQFVSNYTLLGYLETLTLNSREIVKFKIKKQNYKQIFLISNEDCVTLLKDEARNKKVEDFIMSKSNLAKTGKIIIENNSLFTLQKGRPYFFPNCKNDNLALKTNLQYKLIPYSKGQTNFLTNRNVFVNYYNLRRLFVKKNINSNILKSTKLSSKYEFSKLFLKNAGKLYSCLIPQFFKEFMLANKDFNGQLKRILFPFPSDFSSTNSDADALNFNNYNSVQVIDNRKRQDVLKRTILLQNSELISNTNRTLNSESSNCQLTLVMFMEHPFTKSGKTVGLYSITEDFFEQDVNSLFCKNTEFIDSGKTIGLLNLEKEITGDIVQGLPRIEEILEARKKNLTIQRIPTSQKKGLLAQKTSLDNNFEFKKVGTLLKENEKINPHKLIKVYFNYYGLLKLFLCDRTNTFKCARLTNNYEASHKSFKKVQLFILNSVQSVYNSQGVTINDKHLEVIIKQMTTKVLITSEGNAPLLQREVIDLYHIQYINKILLKENKEVACYVPLLLGITKAALNNPSFISAASFQETTRVLTKAAIEGRIDWLRGLKENIITGHLIPAGTGFPNYRNSFKKSSSKQTARTSNSVEILEKSRQIN